MWGAAWSLSAFCFADRPVVHDQLWYWTAVVSLVPPIAVLGAKRPGSEAWNFFVLVPLVLVLGWPALTVWTAAGPGALRVETPVLIGFVLVLVMGCGNYIATSTLEGGETPMPHHPANALLRASTNVVFTWHAL